MEEIIKMYTICLIVNGNRILLLNRQHDSYKGYIAPGGRIEFPESPMECAIREVKEETGLIVRNLKFKGLAEYMNPNKERYMIFNYITYEFEGDLIADSREGKPEWVQIQDISKIEMQENFRRRISLFFEEGTFETHMNRYEEGMKEEHIIKT
ncbi:8-oxo-dGTP diphosphatase [Paenibacillus sp. M1]|uniref:8-oxo-dGTP diphosphatase n=1 Tax=Paenibacillus haidiansis TaxID=1574488 RepID=A0ABU7VQ70_9BACL